MHKWIALRKNPCSLNFGVSKSIGILSSGQKKYSIYTILYL